MPRHRRPKVPYTLLPGHFPHFPKADLRAIIRGADEMILTGGRTLLSKLLKGSKDQYLLKLNLDQSRVYGYFSELTIADIQQRVDWVIANDYLRLEYDRHLPLLVHAPTGWAICKDVRVEEFMEEFDQLIKTQQRPYNISYLKDRDRGMITQLIQTVADSGDPKYIPVLEDWILVDYKKVRQMLRNAIRKLQQ